MIYLTNDELDQAVYFEMDGKPHSVGDHIEELSGFLGNGIFETPVTLRSSLSGVEIIFGRSELFNFVGEDELRRMLERAMAASETAH